MFRTSVPATDNGFFDRQVELARLNSLLARVHARAPEWLAIVGPRKVGKTSLLLEWERRLADPQLACVIVDVMEVAPLSREVFRIYALRIVDRVLGDEAGVGLAELAAPEYRSALQRSPRFERLSPALRAEILELPERSLDGTGISSCLELPERLAKALGLRLVIAIDEFQEIACDDAIALLVDAAPRDRPIDRVLAGRIFDVIGGHPFYLQILGETLTAMPPPMDDLAFKEALSQLLFSRTGRLALYFENEYRRAVGRSALHAAILAVLAVEPLRLGQIATMVKTATGAATSYLDRLGDVVVRGDDDRWRIADPVFAMWLRWRGPGGAAVPMTVVGDQAERAAAEALARLGFDLVYQSRASRGAFDLLATRGAQQLGVQVKQTALPAHIRAGDWKRMQAEGTRLRWRWLVAAVTPDGAVVFLDPGKAQARRGITLAAGAVIENVLLWLDRTGKPSSRRNRSGAHAR